MTTLFLVLAFPFIVLCMIAEHYVAKSKGRTLYTLKEVISNIQHAVGQQVFNVYIRAWFIVIYLFIYDKLRITEISMHWTSWVAVFICHDFINYWTHRANHHFHLLWGMHLVHHTAEEMNISVSLRNPWFIFAFTSIPLYLFGFVGVSPWMLLAISSGSFFAAFWTHSATIPKLGWVERILITPSLHRVHHARNKAYLDKNFGLVLSIWDQLFGTYVPEIEKPEFGITLPVKTDNPLWENLYYYFFLAKVISRTPGIWNKLHLFSQRMSKIHDQFTEAELTQLMTSLSQPVIPRSIHRAPIFKAIAIIILLMTLGLIISMMTLGNSWEMTYKISCSAGIISLLIVNGFVIRKLN